MNERDPYPSEVSGLVRLHYLERIERKICKRQSTEWQIAFLQ